MTLFYGIHQTHKEVTNLYYSELDPKFQYLQNHFLQIPSWQDNKGSSINFQFGVKNNKNTVPTLSHSEVNITIWEKRRM